MYFKHKISKVKILLKKIVIDDDFEKMCAAKDGGDLKVSKTKYQYQRNKLKMICSTNI